MIQWFMKTFPNYVLMMRECSYHYKNLTFNQHHLEGDVWSHTVMAYNLGIKNSVSEEVLWALLLHDIGRVFTRNEIEKKRHVSFGDFEGVSCFVALEILNKSKLTNNQKVNILKIISYQYTIIDFIKYDDPTEDEIIETFLYEKELLNNLAHYVECDLFARVIGSSKTHLYNIEKIKKFQESLKLFDNRKKASSLKKNTLYILVGPPCSRKSSWIKNIESDFIVISRDRYTQEIGKKYEKYSYDESYELMKNNKDVKKEVLALEEECEEYAKNSKGRDIIIDNPNLKLSHRKEWIDALSSSHKIKVILFLTPFKSLLTCSENRSKSIKKSLDEEGYIYKLKTFSYPLLNEGIDEIEHIFND